MTKFGASLKEARESKGISLDQIAKDTRISTRFLIAIENEQFHLLPGGIFNRGFVRAFAEKVGVDPSGAVAEYERLTEVRPPLEAPPAISAKIRTRIKIPRHLYSVLLGIAALILVMLYLVTRGPGSAAQSTTAPATETDTVQEPSSPPQPSRTDERTPEAQGLGTYPDGHGLTVDIEARERTWIRVKSDGHSVNSGELLRAGMTRKFTAQESIDISVSNAGGLALKINQQNAKPLGRRGKSRAVRITRNNVRDFLG